MKAIDFEAGRRRLLEERQADDEPLIEGSKPKANPTLPDCEQDQLALVDRALERLIAGVRSRSCRGYGQLPRD